jgi:hypothetical protein
VEELEGRLSGSAYRTLVRSVAEAGMNTVRVWGGGIYPPRAFYDACDDFGVLLYHDMMYVLVLPWCLGMCPVSVVAVWFIVRQGGWGKAPPTLPLPTPRRINTA